MSFLSSISFDWAPSASPWTPWISWCPHSEDCCWSIGHSWCSWSSPCFLEHQRQLEQIYHLCCRWRATRVDSWTFVEDFEGGFESPGGSVSSLRKIRFDSRDIFEIGTVSFGSECSSLRVHCWNHWLQFDCVWDQKLCWHHGCHVCLSSGFDFGLLFCLPRVDCGFMLYFDFWIMVDFCHLKQEAAAGSEDSSSSFVVWKIGSNSQDSPRSVGVNLMSMIHLEAICQMCRCFGEFQRVNR